MLKDPDKKQLYTINNKQTTPEITEEFADHFSTLLNYPRVAVESSSSTSPDPPLPTTQEENFIISTSDVNTAISMLKSNKTSDPFQLDAEHFMHAENDILELWLCEMFNKLFESSSSPKDMSKSRMIPLVKSLKKSLKLAGNYRGISILPILTKLLEYIIVIKCPCITESHSLQYGFKDNSSTLHAEFIINETIKLYNHKKSPVSLQPRR